MGCCEVNGESKGVKFYKEAADVTSQKKRECGRGGTALDEMCLEHCVWDGVMTPIYQVGMSQDHSSRRGIFNEAKFGRGPAPLPESSTSSSGG